MPRRKRQNRPTRNAVRASMACDHCREKRVRCEGGEPPCVRCKELSLDCTLSRTDLRKVSRSRGGSQMIGDRSSSSRTSRQASMTSQTETAQKRVPAEPSAGPSVSLRPRTIYPADIASTTEARAALLASLPQASGTRFPLTTSITTQASNTDLSGEQPIQQSNTDQIDSFEDFLYTCLLEEGDPEQSTSSASISAFLRASSLPLALLSTIQEFRKDGKLLKPDSIPSDETLNRLVPIFFQHFGDQYHFVRNDKFADIIVGNTGHHLINSICFLAAKSISAESLENDEELKKAVESANQCGNDTVAFVDAHLAEMIANPSESLAITLFTLALQQVFESTPSKFWTYMKASGQVARELTSRTGKDDFDDSRLLLYWTVYVVGRMLSNNSKKEFNDLFKDKPMLPETVDNSQQPLAFAYLVRLMLLVESIPDLIGGELNAEDQLRRLEKCQNDLFEWQLSLPESLRHVAAPGSQVDRPTAFVQVHMWFYYSLIIIQGRVRSLKGQDNGNDLKGIEEWSAQRAADLLVLSSNFLSLTSISSALLLLPITTAQEIERQRAQRLTSESSLESSSAVSHFLSSQIEANVRLFENSLVKIRSEFPGLESIVSESQ